MLLDGWHSVWQRTECDGGDSRKFRWRRGESPFLTETVVVWGVLSAVRSILWLSIALFSAGTSLEGTMAVGMRVELRKTRRTWALVPALCVVEGAHVRMRTRRRHWTTAFVSILLPISTLKVDFLRWRPSPVLCALHSQHLECCSLCGRCSINECRMSGWGKEDVQRKKWPARPEALEARCQRFEHRHRCPG